MCDRSLLPKFKPNPFISSVNFANANSAYAISGGREIHVDQPEICLLSNLRLKDYALAWHLIESNHNTRSNIIFGPRIGTPFWGDGFD